MNSENGDRNKFRFRVFNIASFHSGFNELLFVSIALAPVVAALNLDRSGLSTSHEAQFLSSLTGHRDATGKNENAPIRQLIHL